MKAGGGGNTRTYVCHSEELHKETIDFLLSKGYDIEISHWTNSAIGEEWFNKVAWGKNASGKIRFEER